LDALTPTLLIVDDHEGLRSFARALLGAEGFDVIGEVADGETAVVAVQALHPDVVLLDIELPVSMASRSPTGWPRHPSRRAWS